MTVRLDPPRYDWLKRLVQRLQTTGQSIIQTALDCSMVALERERGRGPIPRIRASSSRQRPPKRPRQDSFAFIRPEPTIALTYPGSVTMHRWLHRSTTKRHRI